MKKILSILLSLSIIISIFAFPVFAIDNNRNVGKKSTNSIQRALDKAQEDLKKALNDKDKLEAAIQKAIVKANSPSTTKPSIDPAALKEKWQEELDKAAAQDKIELDNLNNDISKWNQIYQSQQTVLNKQIADIDANLTKQNTILDGKISTATDAVFKQNLLTSKTNLLAYATARKAAISTYLSSLQAIWANKQKLWDERKVILNNRQTADMTFRTAMTAVKNLELNDKLLVLAQNVPDPANVEATIRAKYKDQTDLIQIRITNLNNLIADLKSNLPK
jgi:hypothetical protein